MAADRQRIRHKRDRLRQLRAFYHAARLGSITRAATYLDLSQPAVSLHVRGLENELDAILFDRGGPGLRLTSAGETLYALAKSLVQDMDALFGNFMVRIDGNISGRLPLAASMAGAAFVLPPYVTQFRDQYPGIRLQVRNCPLSEGVRLLLDDEVEFVLGAKEPSPGDTLVYREILPYDLVLITSLDHSLAGRERVSLEEAAAWPAIVPSAGTYNRQFGETAAHRFRVDVKAVIETGGWGVTKRYVEQNLGVSVVPSLAITSTDRVSVVSLKEYFPTRSYGVFTRRGRLLTPLARRFLQLMIPDFPDPPLAPALVPDSSRPPALHRE